MDRASILGDAIEYLKELLQRINSLHNELESLPPGSALTPTASTFHPLTPTLPSRIKEELCPSLPSPNVQPARVKFLDVLVIVLNPVNFLVKNKYTMPSIRPL